MKTIEQNIRKELLFYILKQQYNNNQPSMAKAMGYTRQALQSWLSEKNKIPDPVVVWCNFKLTKKEVQNVKRNFKEKQNINNDCCSDANNLH